MRLRNVTAVFVAIVLAWLTSTAHAATIYPCDVAPLPAECMGTKLLSAAYSGAAAEVYNPNTIATRTIAFVGDNLDTTAMDTFLNGAIGRVLKVYGQRGGTSCAQTVLNVSGDTVRNSRVVKNIWTSGLSERMSVQGIGIAPNTTIKSIDGSTQITLNVAATTTRATTLTFSEAPFIQTLAIGGARSIVFQGGGNSGALYSLVCPSIASLGVTAKDYSVTMVVQATSSEFTNQASAPGVYKGALFDFEGSGGTVAVVNNNANGTLSPGTWEVTDGDAFNFSQTLTTVQVNPIVLTITSDSTGVKLWQNGEMRATASRSALTRTAATLYLGKLATSVAGGTSGAGDFQIVAWLYHNVGLTQAQQATLASALYDYFLITPSVSTSRAYGLGLMSDSIGAGFAASVGTYGYMMYLQPLLSQPARVWNFAVPGSTVTQHPAGGPTYPKLLGQFTRVVEPIIPTTTLGTVLILHSGGNDTGFGPASRRGRTHGTTTIDGIDDTTGLSPGDFIFYTARPNCGSTLTTIVSVAAHSVVVSSAPTCSGNVRLQFTYAATSPTAVYNGLRSVAASAITAGVRGVIISTVLPRNVAFQPWINALNVLIRAGTGFTLADCAAHPGLNTNPGPSYADAVHPSDLGHRQMAACLEPVVNSLLFRGGKPDGGLDHVGSR